jgi:general secretion pathway protein N
MKRRSAIAIGFGVYVLALGAMAPASLVDLGLRNATGGKLRLAAPQGTIWSGSGELTVRDAESATLARKAVRWRALPLRLLRGELGGDVALGEPRRQFPVTVSFAGVELADVSVVLPAAVLAVAAPRLAPLGLSGDVLVHIPHLIVGPSEIQGRGRVEWRNAGSALTRIAPLGDYDIRLEARGSAVSAALQTIDGPLHLEGSGSWASNAAPALRIAARVPAAQREALAPLLGLIAVKRSEGVFELSLR